MLVAAFAEGLFSPAGHAAASIVVWAAVIAGLASGALPSGVVGRLAAAAGLCLAVTALLATASVGWASDQGRAFEEGVRASLFLGLFVLAVCTGTRRDRDQWLIGLTVGLAAVAIVALLAYMQPGLLGSRHSDIPNAAGRLSYPVGYWNGAGALLASTAILLAHAGARSATRLWRSLAVAVFPLVILGIWLTSSRGAGFAMVVGIAVLFTASSDRSRQFVAVVVGAIGALILILVAQLLPDLASGVTDAAMRSDGDIMSAICLPVVAGTGALAWRSDEKQPTLRVSRPIALAICGLALTGVVVGIVAADPGKRLHQFEQAPPTRAGIAIGAPDLSSNGRWQFWGEAIDAFEAHPLRGVGAGGYENWWARHATVGLFVRNPHSLFLQQASELGVPGLLLLLGFVTALGIAVARIAKQGLSADVGVLIAVVLAGGIGAAVDWTWEIPAVFGPVVVCAGLLVAAAPSRPLARGRRLIAIGTVTVAWFGIIAGGLVALTHLELDRSRDAASRNQVDSGIARARAATTVQPWASEPYTQLALLEEQRGDIPSALAALRQAEQRDADDWRLLLIQARLELKRGDHAATTEAIAQTQRLSPLPLNSLIGGLVSENQR